MDEELAQARLRVIGTQQPSGGLRSALEPEPQDEARTRRPFPARLRRIFGRHSDDIAVLLAVVLGGGLLLAYALDRGLLESILLMAAISITLLAAAAAIFHR